MTLVNIESTEFQQFTISSHFVDYQFMIYLLTRKWPAANRQKGLNRKSIKILKTDIANVRKCK